MEDDPFGDLSPLWRLVVRVAMAVFSFIVVAAFIDAEWLHGQYHPDPGVYVLLGSVVSGVFSAQILIEILRRRRK